jgi:membrane protein involved in colicin uptake
MIDKMMNVTPDEDTIDEQVEQIRESAKKLGLDPNDTKYLIDKAMRDMKNKRQALDDKIKAHKKAKNKANKEIRAKREAEERAKSAAEKKGGKETDEPTKPTVPYTPIDERVVKDFHSKYPNTVIRAAHEREFAKAHNYDLSDLIKKLDKLDNPEDAAF